MKILTVLVGIFLIASCSQKGVKVEPVKTPEPEEMKNINQEDFKSRMGKPGVFILDVRTPLEINEGKIKGALEIDFRSTNFKDKIDKLNRDKAYLVYCRSGVRSYEASQLMIDMGFKDVSNLLGGYSQWKE